MNELRDGRVYTVRGRRDLTLIYCEGDFYTLSEWRRAGRGIDEPSRYEQGDEVRHYQTDERFPLTELEWTGRTEDI